MDLGPLEGLEDIKATVRKTLRGECRPDAVLLNPSMIRLIHRQIIGKVELIARLDGTHTVIGPDITYYR